MPGNFPARTGQCGGQRASNPLSFTRVAWASPRRRAEGPGPHQLAAVAGLLHVDPPLGGEFLRPAVAHDNRDVQGVALDLGGEQDAIVGADSGGPAPAARFLIAAWGLQVIRCRVIRTAVSTHT